MMFAGRAAAVHNATGRSAAVRNDRKRMAYHVGTTRREAAREPQAGKEIALEMIKAYDKDKSGNLDKAQLKHMLEDLTKETLGKDDDVDSLEVDWVLSISDRDSDFTIGPQEVANAVLSWKRYLRSRQRVMALFTKYDTNNSGALEREQLRRLLVELNDDEYVEDEELDWVLETAGGKVVEAAVSKPELEKAITVWYGYVDSLPEKGDENVVRHKGGAVGRAMACLDQRDSKREAK